MARNLVRFRSSRGGNATTALTRRLNNLSSSTDRALFSNIREACIFLEAEDKKAIARTKFFNVQLGATKALVDTGRYLNSIAFDINRRRGRIVGRVGSTIGSPPYPEYLEFGTSRMEAKPVIRPTFVRSRPAIQRIIRNGLSRGIARGL